MAKEFVLTDENYYSAEANKHYCSASQFKQFVGYPFHERCEYATLAELNGEYERPKSNALLFGSYVDTALTEPENLEQFVKDHPEIISSRGATAGQLKSEFKLADKMIEKLKSDKKCMALLSGNHQTIMVGTIFGMDFKIKMDSYKEGKFIVDLKTTEDIYKSYYSKGQGHMSFIEYFDYITQLAIYQEIVRQNTGETLPVYIVAVSKEDEPNIQAIWIDNETLHDRIYGNEFQDGIANDIARIKGLKDGSIKPEKCGKCYWCRKNKVVDKIIDWRELLGEV